MTSRSLGEFEQLVLLAVMRLEGDAYGTTILNELDARTGRDVARGAVYVTLERLERKGFLTSRVGDSTPERGGKAKRFYALSDEGLASLRQAGRDLMSLWQGHEALLEES